jgi:hypothetical protein
MLPDFPHSKDQIRNRIVVAIEAAVRAKAPLLAGIKTLVQHEGTLHAYDRVRAAPVTEEYEEMAIPVTLEVAEVPNLVGIQLEAKIDAIAEHKARVEMDMLYRKQTEVCQEIGNTVNANGAPLNADLLLEMLEKVDVHFAANDQPEGRFVVGPTLDAPLKKLLQEPAFRTRYDDLMERKRDVWRNRESDRKLVD